MSFNYRTSIQGWHEKISLIVGEQLAVLSPRLCENGGDKPQDGGYLETYGSLSWNLFVSPFRSPILVSTAVGPRLQAMSETRIDAKI